jgi:hypothetical protein
MPAFLITMIVLWFAAVFYFASAALADYVQAKRDARIIPWEKPTGPVLPPIAQRRIDRKSL